MANKRDDYGLDDFNFDDFGDDGFGDFDGPAPRKDRKPVTVLAGGFVDGVKDSLTSPRFHRQFLKKALPKGYDIAIDLIDDSARNIKSLYDTAAKESKPIVTELKKGTKLLMPGAKKILPKRVSDTLDKWASDLGQDSSRWGAYDPESDEINSTLGSIFAATQQQQAQREAESEAKLQLRDIVSKRQTDISLQLLSNVSVGINRLVSYQDQIAAKVQRKTLELQYRQYFSTRKSQDVLEQHLALSRDAFAILTKNTALPEAVKIHNSELLGQMMKQRFIGSVTEPMSQWFRTAGKRLFAKAKGDIAGFARDVGAGVSNIVQTGSSVGDAGMSRDDGLHVAGHGIGGMMSEWLAGKIAKPIRKRMEKNQRVAGTALRINRKARELPFLLNDFVGDRSGGQRMASDMYERFQKRRQGDNYAGPSLNMSMFLDSIDSMLGGGVNYAKDAVGQHRRDTMVQRSGVDSLKQAAYWNKKAERSLTEVIPGWLSKIHHEAYMARTGDTAKGPLEFNFHTGKFDTSKDIQAEIIKGVFKPADLEYSRSRVDSVLDSVDPDKKLTKAAREALAVYLIKRASNSQGMGIPELAAGGQGGVPFPEELKRFKRGISKHFRERYGFRDDAIDHTQGKVKSNAFRNDVQSQGRLDSLSTEYGRLHEHMPDWKAGLLDHADQGRIAHLEALGLVKRNEKGEYHQVDDHMIEAILTGKVPGGAAPANWGGHGRPRRFAKGSDGPISGPGTGTSDSIPSLLSNGETVVNAAGSKIPGAAALLKWLNAHGRRRQSTSSNEPPSDTKSNGWQVLERRLTDMQHELVSRQDRTQTVLETMLAYVKVIAERPAGMGGGGGEHDLMGASPEEVAERKLSFKDRITLGLGRMARNSVTGAYRFAKGAVTGSARMQKLIARTSLRGAWLGMKGSLKGGKLLLKSLEDVYILGNPEPVMLARDIRAGLYFDVGSKRIIRNVDDITGEVRNSEGDVVITADDFAHGLYGKRGRMLITRARQALGALRDLGRKVMTNPLTMGWRIAKGLTKRLVGLLDMPGDIYVRGETTPRLYARLFRAGVYRLQLTGEVIHRVAQITGTVIDSEGNVVLPIQDLHRGLVDAAGHPIKGLAGRLLSAAKAIAKLPLTAAKMAYRAGKKVKDTVFAGMGMLGRGLSALRNGTGFSLFGVAKPVVDKLDMIYKLLEERLPARRKRKLMADMNDDGVRDGSWQEQEAQRAKRSLLDRTKDRFAAFKGKTANAETGEAGSGLLGMLGKLKGLGITGLLTGMGTFMMKLIPGLPTVMKFVKFMGSNAWKLATGGFNLGGKLLGAGRTALNVARGAGGIVRSAMGMARLLPFAEGIAGLAASAGAVLTAPVLIGAAAVAATAYVGYRLYKHYNTDTTPLAKFRIAQYGYKLSDKDNVARILTLEAECLKIVRVSKGSPAVLTQGKTVSELLKIFNVDEQDKKQVEKWISWFTLRFKPIFLGHVTTLYELTGKTDLARADVGMIASQKLEYLHRVHFTKTTRNPYAIMMAPGPSDESVPLTVGDVKDAYDEAVSYVKDHAKESDAALAASQQPKVIKRPGPDLWERTKDAGRTIADGAKSAYQGAVNSVSQGIENVAGSSFYKGAVDLFSRGMEAGANAYKGAVNATSDAATYVTGKVGAGWSKRKSPTLDANISAAAQRYGVDEQYLRTMAMIESGGDPNAKSPTGAAGIYQFVRGTGAQYGLLAGGRDMRFDEAANVDAGARFAKDNMTALASKLGRQPEPWMLYMAHQQGSGGAGQLLNLANKGQDATGKLRTAMDLNGGRGMSPAQFLETWRQRYGAKAVQAAGGTAVATAPKPAAKAPAVAATPVAKPVTPPTAPAAKAPAVAATPVAKPVTPPPTAPAAKAPAVASAPAPADAKSNPVMAVSYSPMDVAKSQEAIKASVAQQETQRQASTKASASDMSAAIEILQSQLKVQMSMDRTLTAISKSLMDFGQPATSPGKDAGMAKTPSKNPSTPNPADMRQPPVSMAI